MVEINARTGLPNIATVSALAGDGMGIKDILVDNNLELQRITRVLTSQLTSIAQNMDTLVSATITANENAEFRRAEEEAEARRREYKKEDDDDEDDDPRKEIPKPKGSFASAIRLALAGLALGIQDAIKGIDVAEALGVEKLSGFIGGFFGGTLEGGFLSSLVGGVKGAALGAAAGLPFGPLGAIAGALIGGALFAVTGYLGSLKMIDFFDPIIVAFKRTLGLSVTTTEEELKIAKEIADDAKAAVDKISDNLDATNQAISDAVDAGAPDEEILALRVQAIELAEQMKERQREYNKHLNNQMNMERDKGKNAENAAKNQLKEVNLEIQRLEMEKNFLEYESKRLDENSAEYTDIMNRLAVNDARLSEAYDTRITEQNNLADIQDQLLAQDKELVRVARENNTRAPLRAELNVWFSNLTEGFNTRLSGIREAFDGFSFSSLRTSTEKTLKEYSSTVENYIDSAYKDISQKIYDPETGNIFGLDLWPDELFAGVKNYLESAYKDISQKIYDPETGNIFGLDLWPDELFANLQVSITQAWENLRNKIYNPETGELFGINFGAIFDSIPSIDEIIAKIKVSLAKTRIGSLIFGDPNELVEDAERNLVARSEALGALAPEQRFGSNEAAEFEKAKIQLEALKKAVEADGNSFNKGTIPDTLTSLNSMDPLMKDFGKDGTLAVLHDEEAIIPAQSAVADYIDTLFKVNMQNARASSPSTGTSTPGSAPINVRNNNPLNIRPPSGEQFQGTVGQSGGFATFATPEMGFRAAAKLLETYQSKYNLDTVYKIISRWAPSGDNNDPRAYAEAVASKLGIGINDAIDLSEDPELTQRLIAAMAEHEGGQSMSQMGFNNEQIASGLAMATGDEQVPVNLAQSTVSGVPDQITSLPPADSQAPPTSLFGALTTAFGALSSLDDLTGSIEGGLMQLDSMTPGMNIDGNVLGSVSSDINKERQGGSKVMIGDASSKNVNTITNNTTNARTINANIDARNNNSDVSRYNVLVTV